LGINLRSIFLGHFAIGWIERIGDSRFSIPEKVKSQLRPHSRDIPGCKKTACAQLNFERTSKSYIVNE
jgi:hypothetical protein